MLKIFDSYKFTIEENTPVEEEMALDPELLGKVFENLLASYNPDTKTTARKKIGSFFTPREVVDYMVDEALVCYLEMTLAPAANAQSAIIFIANGLLDLDHGPGDLPLTASDLPPLPLLERLRKAGQPLGEYCKGRFYYGIKTGLNEAFVISQEQRDVLGAQDPESANMIKPFLRGRDIKRWNVEFEELYLIKIESSENAAHPWSGLPADKAEKNFAKTHPSIYAWFTADGRRQQLIDRTDQGRYFWELRSCAYWDLFTQPKIIYPDIYLHQSLAWDETGLYCANTGYFIPNAEKWLTAVLNSAAMEWFYDQISTRMQGGYLRAFTDKMKALPIPNSDDEQRKVIESCVDAVLQSISRPEYERLLNGLVYELFFPEDLHAKNIRLFDACTAAGIREGMDAQAVATTIFRNNHPIYGMLFDLPSLEVVRIIEGLA